MKTCAICGKQVSCLGKHIRFAHKMTSEEYYKTFITDKVPTCPVCGGPVKFQNLELGYQKYCSNKCLGKSEEVKAKRKQTMLERFGVENPTQNAEIRSKSKATCLLKYGVDNPSKSLEIKRKMKDVFIDKYGADNPMKNPGIVQKLKTNMCAKYGVSAAMHMPATLEKVVKRNKETMFQKLLNSDRLKSLVIPDFNIEDYDGVSDGKRYWWICTTCNTRFSDHIDDGHIPRCFTCYPKLKGTSFLEKEIFEFVSSLGITAIENDRSIITPKEIDVFIPGHNLGIELNGVYWHSEANGMGKQYHISKTENCLAKGTILLQFFEDEWIEKKDIVKSIILSKLGMCQKIYARKCELKKVSYEESCQFLIDNHLQGMIGGKSTGLYYEDRLVSLLVLGTPRFDRDSDCEILRFCNRRGFSVIGGLSRLIHHIPSYSTLISYVDRRYGTGTGYASCGMTQCSTSEPSYYYLKQGKRYNRMDFQKHKLEEKLDIFDPNLTEWQNMQLNGYDRIWDCGTLKFSMKK